MIYETIFMLAVSVLGLVQNLLSERQNKFNQIQRNFNETYFIVIICFLIALVFDGAGTPAVKAAGIYFSGRLFYVLLTLINQIKYRKWAWALSMIGVIGWVLIAIRAIAQQFI